MKKPFSIIIQDPKDGSTTLQTVVEYRTFSDVLGGQRFRFAVHRGVAAANQKLILSNMDSGMIVTTIAHTEHLERGWTVVGREALQDTIRHSSEDWLVAALRAVGAAAAAANGKAPALAPPAVWCVGYIYGKYDPNGVFAIATEPPVEYRKATGRAEQLLADHPGWRVWVRHRKTHERIFESEAEKAFQAARRAA